MVLDPCRWVRARLPLLAGDDLVGSERRCAERHLVGCPDCRRHLQALEGAVQTLRAVAEVPALAHPETTPSLWPDLARQIRESRREYRFAGLHVLAASPAFALAATLLLTVTGGLIAGFLGERREPRPEMAVRSGTAPVREPVVAAKPRVERDDPDDDTYANRPTSLRERSFKSDHAILSRPTVEDTR